MDFVSFEIDLFDERFARNQTSYFPDRVWCSIDAEFRVQRLEEVVVKAWFSAVFVAVADWMTTNWLRLAIGSLALDRVMPRYSAALEHCHECSAIAPFPCLPDWPTRQIPNALKPKKRDDSTSSRRFIFARLESERVITDKSGLTNVFVNRGEIRVIFHFLREIKIDEAFLSEIDAVLAFNKEHVAWRRKDHVLSRWIRPDEDIDVQSILLFTEHNLWNEEKMRTILLGILWKEHRTSSVRENLAIPSTFPVSFAINTFDSFEIAMKPDGLG